MTITRRDFLNGTALAIAAGLAPLDRILAAEPSSYYPPALTGLRGSHPGSFEVAHALAREGKAFALDGLAVEENYDLVVVGGGISGLSAAWFFQRKHRNARILILDNHDDFGGHAKRNEFTIGRRMALGYGGSESLQSPKALYSPVAKGLLKELAVDIERFNEAFDSLLYPSLDLSSAVFFDKESFGADKLVKGDPMAAGQEDMPSGRRRSIRDFVADTPLSETGKRDLLALYETSRDYLAGKSNELKLRHLRKTSYRDYLLNDAKIGKEAAMFFQGNFHDFFAIGADGVPAYDAMELGYPGFAGLALSIGDNEYQAILDEPYIYHFPDGNASLARLLVRKLIPNSVAGRTMEDIVTARLDYAKLDGDTSRIRIRLNSTAVAVRNPSGPVDIAYVRQGRTHRIQGKACVLACYNMMIPYLAPDMPAEQKDALAQNVKAPLVYVNVAIRDWRAFAALGIQGIYSPMAFFPVVKLDYPVSLGGYEFPKSPNDPMVLHMVHVPTEPNRGLSAREQSRRGRMRLLEMTFDDFERRIVDQLNRMLGAGGFDAARDIAAITVNRWPHGYAYSFNSLFDDDTDPPIIEIARKPWGKVTIANSDAGWDAYAHVAIDQAWRAVGELS